MTVRDVAFDNTDEDGLECLSLVRRHPHYGAAVCLFGYIDLPCECLVQKFGGNDAPVSCWQHEILTSHEVVQGVNVRELRADSLHLLVNGLGLNTTSSGVGHVLLALHCLYAE